MILPSPHERAGLLTRPGILPVYVQGWRGWKDAIAAYNLRKAALYVDIMRDPGTHPHPAISDTIKCVVVRVLVYHWFDWSSHWLPCVRKWDSHTGDSESAVFVYIETGDELRTGWVMTRSHRVFNVYENPGKLDGCRFWIMAEPEGHGLSLAQRFEDIRWPRVRLYTAEGDIPVVGLPVGWSTRQYAPVDMQSAEFDEREARALFRRLKLDWPSRQYDRRLTLSKLFRGDRTSPWSQPLSFLRKCYRAAII